jgi:hypothetical protein
MRETRTALANMKKATHALICESPMIDFGRNDLRVRSAKPQRKAA